MDAERLLQRMCARHGLSPDTERELLPLMQRALISPDDVRRRIFAMIEDTVRRRSVGDTTATLKALELDLDDEVLNAVAKSVHSWDPPWRKKPFGARGDQRLNLSSDDLPGGLGGTL